MLAKIGAGAHESHLMCGGHHSVDPELAQAWYRDVYTPQRINNNCSGKHVGMFAGARAIGASLEGYHLEGHPIQQRVIKVVEEVSGLSKDEVYWGIDGCNMPAAAMPLKNLAQAFVHFAKAADETAKTDVNGADTDSVSGVASALTQRTVLSATVFNAMAHHADMVAGRGRFCTLLMDAFEGTLIGKVGAEGGYGIGIRASKDMKTRLGVDGALGIAVKVGDGNLDVLYAAVSEIIERLGLGSPEARKKLDGFHYPKLKNTMGVITGEMAFPFVIHKC